MRATIHQKVRMRRAWLEHGQGISSMTKKDLDRADILKLAAQAQLDVRTVKKAVAKGIGSLRAEVDKERLRIAAKSLKLSVAWEKEP